jgi:hypothetical protein
MPHFTTFIVKAVQKFNELLCSFFGHKLYSKEGDWISPLTIEHFCKDHLNITKGCIKDLFVLGLACHRCRKTFTINLDKCKLQGWIKGGQYIENTGELE